MFIPYNIFILSIITSYSTYSSNFYYIWFHSVSENIYILYVYSATGRMITKTCNNTFIIVYKMQIVIVVVFKIPSSDCYCFPIHIVWNLFILTDYQADGDSSILRHVENFP